ncbi:MAG: hypothetical protein AUG44_28315 [Actinobacteria bacterium 13_1_20CM_3_71_11]|nr:MAG: hypothetical protein AUG44_28315 [Actinobacteria bacterium 13_1_20CM_3_71_11]
MIYLDSCALVKLVTPAPETPALERYLREHAAEHHVASALVRTEVRRALTRVSATARQRSTADKLLDAVITISITDDLLDEAGRLPAATGRRRASRAGYRRTALIRRGVPYRRFTNDGCRCRESLTVGVRSPKVRATIRKPT